MSVARTPAVLLAHSCIFHKKITVLYRKVVWSHNIENDSCVTVIFCWSYCMLQIFNVGVSQMWHEHQHVDGYHINNISCVWWIQWWFPFGLSTKHRTIGYRTEDSEGKVACWMEGNVGDWLESHVISLLSMYSMWQYDVPFCFHSV